MVVLCRVVQSRVVDKYSSAMQGTRVCCTEWCSLVSNEDIKISMSGQSRRSGMFGYSRDKLCAVNVVQV